MRILVTGGLGFIGAALVQALVKRGETVRVLDNSSRGSKEKLDDAAGSVEIIEGDIRDPAIVRRAVQGVDSVAHLAFVNGTEFFYKYPAYVLDVGVKGMVNVLDACIAGGVKEFILASSSETYQTPPAIPTDESAPLVVPDVLNPRYSYGGGKMISELMAINYGREEFERVIIFRPHNVYGPAMGWEHVIPQFAMRLKELKKQAKGGSVQFPIQGDGRQTRSFMYIEDFTDGLIRVMDEGEHLNVYHIGTMDEVTIRDVALQVARAMGMEATIIPGAEAAGSTPRRCPDTAKLTKLGFAPKFSLRDGLKPTVQWYLEHDQPAASSRSEPRLFIPEF